MGETGIVESQAGLLWISQDWTTGQLAEPCGKLRMAQGQTKRAAQEEAFPSI